MLIIRFKAKLFKIGSWTLLRLPKNASAKLPSRGVTMVEGSINGFNFQAALEPDGNGSHWFRVNKTMRKAAGADEGDTVMLVIKPIKEWPEPKIPVDLKQSFAVDSLARSQWASITPIARWDWIRWITSTKHLETRKQRIKRMSAMLKNGKRRPCCFNRNQCTVSYVSDKGVLLEPSQTKKKRNKNLVN